VRKLLGLNSLSVDSTAGSLILCEILFELIQFNRPQNLHLTVKLENATWPWVLRSLKQVIPKVFWHFMNQTLQLSLSWGLNFFWLLISFHCWVQKYCWIPNLLFLMIVKFIISGSKLLVLTSLQAQIKDLFNFDSSLLVFLRTMFRTTTPRSPL